MPVKDKSHCTSYTKDMLKKLNKLFFFNMYGKESLRKLVKKMPIFWSKWDGLELLIFKSSGHVLIIHGLEAPNNVLILAKDYPTTNNKILGSLEIVDALQLGYSKLNKNIKLFKKIVFWKQLFVSVVEITKGAAFSCPEKLSIS